MSVVIYYLIILDKSQCFLLYLKEVFVIEKIKEKKDSLLERLHELGRYL